MDKIKVEVDIIRKSIFEFTVDAVFTPDGDLDEEAVKIKAAEAYEKAEEDGSLYDHFYSDDFEYDVGDQVVDDEYD